MIQKHFLIKIAFIGDGENFFGTVNILGCERVSKKEETEYLVVAEHLVNGNYLINYLRRNSKASASKEARIAMTAQ